MCTGIRLHADNGSVVYARTLEFAQDINSNIVVIPRDYAFTESGLHWKSTYAVVGANACNTMGIVDGVNECGLAGGLFYFTNYAQYQKVTNPDNTIAPWELITFLLTTCSTLAQVRSALQSVTVADVIFKPWNSSIPLHAIVHDPAGNSLVIEYVEGKLVMHDNPLGVITNAPTFDWHMTNLDNYAMLSPYNNKAQSVDGTTLTPLGQGSGMLGLPGDFTSPSRFVRAVAFSQSVVDIPTEDAARDAAFHLLNLFDIPRGSVREDDGTHVTYERTQWTSAADLHNKRYYWHTYTTRHVQMVDLMRTDLDATEPLIIPMEADEIISDVTPIK